MGLLYLGQPGEQPLKVRRGIDCYFDLAMADGQKILSSTNASPIGIVATAHNLTTGDVVEVDGHELNTTANGQRTVTVVDADRVTLDGTTGIAVGGRTGTIGKLFDFSGRTQQGQVREAKDLTSGLIMNLAISLIDQYTIRVTFAGAATASITQRIGYFDVLSINGSTDTIILVEGSVEFEGTVTAVA